MLARPAWAQIAAQGKLHDELVSLLRTPASDPVFLAIALGAAFLAGAAHALTPGHGKALVAAYLAGSRGTAWDAVYLGTVVTITHTSTVFVLGGIALYASRKFVMEEVFSWLSIGSGALIVGFGLWLLRSRWRALRGGAEDGGHGHAHGPGGHHQHGHSHATKAGRGGLISLGVSAGLVPCPESITVLLISLSINRLGFGLVLLAAFTLGLAAVLIAIGVAMTMAGPALDRFSASSRLMRWLPVGSAALVTLLGCAILFASASSAGWFGA